MMAQVSAILVVVILVFEASGQVLRNGHCPKVNSEERLDVSKYMGTWYEQVHTRRWTGLELKCNIEFLIEDTTTRGYHLHSYMYSPGANRTFHVHGKARFLSETESRLLVKIDILEKEGEVWILGTDLTSYTVMYSCLNIKNHHFVYSGVEREMYVLENLVIMTREPHPPNSVLNKAFRVLSKNKIRPTKMQFTSHYACPQINVEAMSRAHSNRPDVHPHDAAIKHHIEATQLHIKHEGKLPEHVETHTHHEENMEKTENIEKHENKILHSKDTHEKVDNKEEMEQNKNPKERENIKKEYESMHESHKESNEHQEHEKIMKHANMHSTETKIPIHKQHNQLKSRMDIMTTQTPIVTKHKKYHALEDKKLSGKHDEEHKKKTAEIKDDKNEHETPEIKDVKNEHETAEIKDDKNEHETAEIKDDKNEHETAEIKDDKNEHETPEIKDDEHEQHMLTEQKKEPEIHKLQDKNTEVEARKLNEHDLKDEHDATSQINKKNLKPKLVTCVTEHVLQKKQDLPVTTTSPEVKGSKTNELGREMKTKEGEKHEPENKVIKKEDNLNHQLHESKVVKPEDHVLHHSTLPPEIKAKKLEENDLHSLPQDKPPKLHHPIPENKIIKLKPDYTLTTSSPGEKELKIHPHTSNAPENETPLHEKFVSKSDKLEDKISHSTTEITEVHLISAVPHKLLAPEINTENPHQIIPEIKSEVKDKPKEDESVTDKIFKKEILVGHELTAPKPNKMVPIKMSSRLRLN